MTDLPYAVHKQRSAFETFVVRLSGARVPILFTIHAAVFVVAYAFSYLVRFEFTIPPEYLATFRASAVVVIGFQLLTGALFGFYRGWWRYVGIVDVTRLVTGLSAATSALYAFWYAGPILGVSTRLTHTPRGVLLIDWAFSLLILFGARVLIRLGRERMRSTGSVNGTTKRVLIIGAGDAGETLAREIEHRPQLGMKVAGFVDDQRAKWRSHIRGIKVFGPISHIRSIVEDVRADEALIAIPSASGKRLREIIEHLSSANLVFKTIPGIDHLVSGKVHVTQLRPVNVDDLMRRKRIDLPGDPVRHLFSGKRVVVTGAGGTIGSELASQILELEPEILVLVERSEYALYEVRKRLSRETGWAESRISCKLHDVGDAAVMERLIAEHKPHIVLHAAAHKHVPLGEENPTEYLRNNTLATRKLAEICAAHGVERFLLISTDKAINPTSVMGATKRAAEVLLLDLARRCDMKCTVVRFGNVIGSSGSVIPLFMEQIAAGEPITVTHQDVTRYFIRTSEAISLVLQAATLGDDGQIFMLDMGEPVKIIDLARDLIRLSNHTEDEIPIIITGLRPGEKLFEEIRLEGESISPTIHPHIVITKTAIPQTARIAEWIRRAEGAMSQPVMEAVETLRDLVPEYGEAETTAPSDRRGVALMPVIRTGFAVQ